MSRAGHPVEVVRSRLRQAHFLSEDPTATLGDLARTWGVSSPAASNFLKKHNRELKEEFGARQRLGNAFSKEDALWRLHFIKSQYEKGRPRVRVAELLGISNAGLTQWLERWAPDGVDTAIADLEE